MATNRTVKLRILLLMGLIPFYLKEQGINCKGWNQTDNQIRALNVNWQTLKNRSTRLKLVSVLHTNIRKSPFPQCIRRYTTIFVLILQIYFYS